VFTGIVSEVGAIDAVEATPNGARIRVRAPETAADAGTGDSVAIDGCCLTVVRNEDGVLAFQAVAETLRRTTLGRLAAGDPVNLEAAMRVGERLGGHWVQGHVDGVGTVTAVEPDGDGTAVTFAAPAAILRTTIEKGSMCVAGVSLTVTACGDETFAVALIPHTRAVTTLGRLAPGMRVNLEADLVGKHVAKLLSAAALIPSNEPP
jgi:riboflavin synthase